LALLALVFQVYASDIRKEQEVVDKVIAAMPAKDAATLQPLAAELATCAPETVELLGRMLEPAVKANNAKVEYAISGVVNYACTQPYLKPDVLKGLEAAMAAQDDPDAKAFLGTQIRLLGPAPAPDKLAPVTVLAAKDVLKAVRSNDRSVRVRALNDAPTDDAFAARLVKAPKAKGAEADILYWLAQNGKGSQLPYVLKQIDGSCSDDAISAAALLGGELAAEKLCSLLGTEKAPQAVAALKYFNGNIGPALVDAAGKAEGNTLKNILEVASARHITPLMSKAASSGNFFALKGLVGPSDATYMAELLDSAGQSDVDALKEAYSKAVSYSKDSYAEVMKVIGTAKNPSRFYGTLAGTCSTEAVKYLSERYWEGRNALLALSDVDDSNAADVIWDACKMDSKYLPKYLKLVANGNDDLLSKTEKYKAAMSVAVTAKEKAQVFSSMSTIAIPEMLSEVEKYLDDAKTRRNAALAAQKIIIKGLENMDKTEAKRVGERVIYVLNNTDNPDDAYDALALKKVVDTL